MNLKMEDFDKEIKNINSTVSEQENHIKEVNLTVSEYGDEIKEMNTTLSEGIEKNSILIKELQAFHEGNLNNSSLIEVLGNGTSEASKELWKKWIIHFEVQLIKNHYISACCPRMKLSLFNAVWDSLVPGIYKETGPRPGGTPVNGRNAWISENTLFAIWYVPDDNSWVVGNFSEIGNDGFVYLKGEGDAKCPQKVTNWRFYNGTGLEIANAGDIMMECKPEGKNHNILY